MSKIVRALGHWFALGSLLSWITVFGNSSAATDLTCLPSFFAGPFTSLPLDGPGTGICELDVDGNGLSDLAASYYRYVGGDRLFETSIAFFVQQPDGTYLRDRVVTIEGVVGYLGNRAGDFNGDDLPDLVVANELDGGPQAIAYLGEPGGGFQRVDLVLPGLRGFEDATIADLSGDGHDDLICREFYSDRVAVFLSRGDGTFDAPQLISTLGRSSGLVAADFDGDGRADVATASLLGGLTILLRRPEGGFSEPIGVPTAAPRTAGITVGDFNHDGAQDLVVMGRGDHCDGSVTAPDNTVYVHLGRGDGTFAPGSATAVGPYPRPAAVGDLNRDGNADLIVGLWGGYTLIGCPFAEPPTREATAAARSVAMVPADVSSGFPRGGVAVLFGDGLGGFSLSGSYPAGESVDRLLISTKGCDEYPDIVALDPAPWGDVNILGGRGDGTLEPERSYPTLEHPRGAAAADFDEDGHAECAVANLQRGSISLFAGLDGSSIPTRTEFAAGPAPNDLISADFNEDGNPDLAVACLGAADSSFACDQGGGGVAILLGNGAGGLAPQAYTPLDGRPNGVVSGDLNRDGHLDLVVPMYSPCGGVWVLMGRGDGQFDASRVLEADIHPGRVMLGDVDRDGILDLISDAYFGFGPSIARGRGDGTFQPPEPVAGASSVRAVLDTSGDGVVDLVATVAAMPALTELRGRGDGTFEAARTLDFADLRIVPVELDGDGMQDLVLSENHYVPWLSSSVGVCFSGGGNPFSRVVRWGTGTAPSGVAAGDVNGDGRPDLLVANSDSRNLSVLMNRGGKAAALVARAFLLGNDRTIPLGRSGGAVRIRFQPGTVGVSANEIVLSSIHMSSAETGSVASIPADTGKEARISDSNGDGVPELELQFRAADVSALFSSVRGRRVVSVTIEGLVTSGRLIQASMSLTILGTQPKRPAISPNPLGTAGELRFATSRNGPLIVTIYDVQGRLVATPLAQRFTPAGNHRVPVDARKGATGRLSSGVYFFRIVSVDGVHDGRFMILK